MHYFKKNIRKEWHDIHIHGINFCILTFTDKMLILVIWFKVTLLATIYNRDGTNVLTFKHLFVLVHIQILKYHFKHSICHPLIFNEQPFTKIRHKIHVLYMLNSKYYIIEDWGRGEGGGEKKAGIILYVWY